jgi:hypothetical protein
MASESHDTFSDNIVDVQRLVDSHGELSRDGRGKRALGHITRSGVVLLCAAWEVYLEDVVLECVGYITTYLDDASQLPTEVQSNLVDSVEDDPHDLKPIHLAGEGWKELYQNYTRDEIEWWHTPKSTPINELFSDYLGVEKLSYYWSYKSNKIDQFVSVRGEIAHNGRAAGYVRIDRLTEYLELVRSTVDDTDEFLTEYLRNFNPEDTLPWYRTYGN